MTRVYLPATLDDIAALAATGVLGPAPLTAHAVTGAVRAAFPEADDEELEYAALTAAAQRSVTAGDTMPTRRVVVAADVDAAGIRDAEHDDDPSAVTVAWEVPRKRVVSVHIDSVDAEDAVAATRAAAGSAAYDEALERCLDHELEWYATQEIEGLLDR